MQYKQAIGWEDYINRQWSNKDYSSGYQFTPKEDQCLHLQCPSCHGTGRDKYTGGVCIHHLSCPCPRCTLR